MERVLERNCSRASEMKVVEVHDGRVSKEDMLTIKQLLLEFKVSCSKIKFMELDTRSI